MMAYAKIVRIFTVWFMVSTCMHMQGWWFTDWLFNKPLAPQIQTDRAGNDLLTTAACLTGATLFSGFACYKWYSAKKQIDRYKKNIEEKEQKIVKLTTENNEYEPKVADLEARYKAVDTTIKNAQLLREQLAQRAKELNQQEAQLHYALAQQLVGVQKLPEETERGRPKQMPCRRHTRSKSSIH